MMNCKEASKLLSESRDHDIGLGKRLGLRFHLMMCRMCRIYNRQTELLGKLSRRAGEMVMGKGTMDQSLAPATKDRIKENLRGSD